MDTHKIRINSWTGGLLVGFALIIDLVQFLVSFLHVIPWAGNAVAFVVGTFLSFFAYISLGVWFALLGINYFSGKRAALKVLTLLATFGIELIPLLNAIPAVTAGVVTMIIVSRIEDAAGTSTKGLTAVLEGKREVWQNRLARAKTEQKKGAVNTEYRRFGANLSKASYKGTRFEDEETRNRDVSTEELTSSDPWVQKINKDAEQYGRFKKDIPSEGVVRGRRSVDLEKPRSS
jgi:hypothetical protein